MTSPRFEDVTETTGIRVTGEAARMLYTRYSVAAECAAGRRVLELACGSGQGFGLVGARARSLVGGDLSMALLRGARAHYQRRVPLAQLAADQLPFRSGVFDLVLFFEASYYVPSLESALNEVARVLASDGAILFVNANPERPDFIRSPHSVHYHSADEFRVALQRRGFTVTTEGAFPVEAPADGLRARLARATVPIVRRALRGLGLVPRTLRGRARLKRLVYRHLIELPAELPPDFAVVEPRAAVSPGPVSGFKVLYVTGTSSAPHSA